MKLQIIILSIILLVQIQQISGFYNSRNLQENTNYADDIKRIKEKICINAAEQTGDKSLTNNANEESVKGISEQAKEWDFLKNAADGKNYLRKYLYRDSENGDKSFDEEKLLIAVGEDIAPLAVLLVLSILGWILYIVCYCLDCLCPKCICCKKNSTQHFSKFEMRWPIFGIFIFSLLIVVSSIFGLTQGVNFTDGFYVLTCKFTSFINEFNQQNEKLSWYGLEKLKKEIRIVGQDFHTKKDETFSLQTSEGQTNDQELDLDTQYDSLLVQSDLLWTDSQEQYIYQDLPYYYAQNNNQATQLESNFYNTVWGPIETELTHTYNIKQIVEEPLKLIKEGIQDASEQALQMDTSSIDDVITDGITEIEKFQKELRDLAKQIEDETDTLEENILPSIKTGINWYFILSIIFAVLAFVGAFLVYCTRLFKIRVCIHISWCLISIWMVVGFALATGLYTTSLIGVQSCDIIEDIKKDPKYLKDLDIVSDDIMEKLNTCKEGGKWSGTGDILSQFNIQQQLDDIRNLGTDVQNSVDTNQEQLDNLQEIDNYLREALKHLDSLKYQGFIEAEEQRFYEINYQQDGNLQQGLSQSGADNFYIIDYSSCNPPYTSFSIYDGDDGEDNDQQEGEDYQEMENGVYKQCYPEKSMYQILTNPEITEACGNIHTYFQDESSLPQTHRLQNCDHINEDLAWVKAKNQITLRKEGQLTEFKDQFKTYEATILDWVNKISNFDSEVNEVFVAIDVVLENVDCRFVGSNIDSILNVICDTAIPDIYWLGIALIINSVFLFFGSIFMVCAGYRFANVFPKEKKQKGKREDKYKVAETKTQD